MNYFIARKEQTNGISLHGWKERAIHHERDYR